MKISKSLLAGLQKRLKVGNKRGVHLNGIPGNSRYKFDLGRLSYLNEDLPNNFINQLLTEVPLKFRISWKDITTDVNTIFEEDKSQLVAITKSIENLINQTEAIEQEKGINTFGFGFPMILRRDQADNTLTVAPLLIWSLRIKRTNEFNTWDIIRSEDDSIYLNEVLINHLWSDSNVEIGQIPSEMLEDGLISKDELLKVCTQFVNSINPNADCDLINTLSEKLNSVSTIKAKSHYDGLPITSTNPLVEFGGIFSIFEVQKQNIINDYEDILSDDLVELEMDDLINHFFQPLTSIETDPSQQGILNSLSTKRNLLIQGPPGTGKSQTLTAILINALENKKRTIVVCEKRTALEVLETSLIKNGLGDNCVLIKDIIKDRKAVVDSVRARIENNGSKLRKYGTPKYQHLSNETNALKTLIKSINGRHKMIGREVFDEENWTVTVGKYLKRLKNIDYQDLISLDRKEFLFVGKELSNIVSVLEKGESLYQNFKSLESNDFINTSVFNNVNLIELEENAQIDYKLFSKRLTDIKSYDEILYDEYYNKYLKENEPKRIQYQSLRSNLIAFNELDKLRETYYKEYFTLRNTELVNGLSEITKRIEALKNIENEYLSVPEFYDIKKTNTGIYKFSSLFSSSKKELIEAQLKVQYTYKAILEYCATYRINISFEYFDDIKTIVSACEIIFQKLLQYSVNISSSINSEYLSFEFRINENHNFHSTNYYLICEKLGKLQQSLSFFSYNFDDIKAKLNNDLILFNIGFPISWNREEKQNDDFEHFIDFLDQNRYDTLLEEQINFEWSHIDIFKSGLDLPSKELFKTNILNFIDDLNNTNWFASKFEFNGSFENLLFELEKTLRRFHKYFSKENNDLENEYLWFSYYNQQPEKFKLIINELKGRDNWIDQFVLFYLNTVLIRNSDNVLSMDDSEYKSLDTSLRKFKKEQIYFIQSVCNYNQLEKVREFKETHSAKSLSVDNLYSKKSGTKHKRLSLRQIVNYDPDLFTAFFPIILTTPDVCSNLFKGFKDYFDIVLFDEASQLKIEDNLPALLKGKQIIIAGDEHQMPPSNYFSKMFDDATIEDEDDIDEEEIKINTDELLLSCESLLDFGVELNFERQFLDFHYRSRHPYLIDYSNFAFYNQRLKPLPNSFEYTPIKYIQVKGTFSDHVNNMEADMVLSILENNINRLPNGKYPSVGIATFNINQRNLIKSKILERQKFGQFKSFNDKILELEENGFFIKNLENIQGDERDVIIISTTYGVNKDGVFNRRFGPITHSKGYKLLNVIVTRAKYKVYVCTSIPEDVFMDYAAVLKVEQSNNRTAAFFAYLAYSKAVSEKNEDLRSSVLLALSENTASKSTHSSLVDHDLESPFEEEVYDWLVNKYGSERIETQHKFAGFRIDLVYRSTNPNIKPIAIECDGAKYHSSEEAYLYDRYRQKILTDHGFIFHRIWSTNWWRNSKKEAQNLFDFIETVENKEQLPLEFDSKNVDLNDAFNDDIQDLSTSNQLKVINSDEDRAFVHSINDLVDVTDVQDVIAIDDIVKVKYLNNQKTITVQIVRQVKSKFELQIDGIQKINFQSKLAEAILKHRVGDIVKIGDLDNFIEILEISH
ncbi:hypothetical protein G9H58_09040 [Aquirufa antheringensis]|uniref:AAA domain-containing protein n=1 Tax=Aquirufa antheringensis TaxID=2516559 RepID=UPI0022A8355B|nr:AAA domain-containing protein [Aquirufa antheringensis]MCZ2478209.1 hypothetical protein [Aquirufa antheringensis]